MALIESRDGFATGIGSIEHEHRELIALINEIHDRVDSDNHKSAVLEFFGALHAGISSHFALEEVIMRAADYDEYDVHKAEHERLLDDIRDIMDAYDVATDDEYRGTLGQHLEDWFLKHFRTMDARLHRIIG
jgi:hemerythrin-like metal-binding protein